MANAKPADHECGVGLDVDGLGEALGLDFDSASAGEQPSARGGLTRPGHATSEQAIGAQFKEDRAPAHADGRGLADHRDGGRAAEGEGAEVSFQDGLVGGWNGGGLVVALLHAWAPPRLVEGNFLDQ
jgi:hypothetical protein